LQRIIKLSKIWVWDPGSGKNLFRIPDPGIIKTADPGSESATLLTGDTPVHKFSHHTGRILLAQNPTSQRAHCAVFFSFYKNSILIHVHFNGLFSLTFGGYWRHLSVALRSQLPVIIQEGVGNFRGLHGMGEGRNSLKISAPHPLIKTPLSASSVSLDSTFKKVKFNSVNTKIFLLTNLPSQITHGTLFVKG
jgi:hypothetical protein